MPQLAVTEKLRWTLSDFDIGKPLGRGKFSHVYVAREKRQWVCLILEYGAKGELYKELQKYKCLTEKYTVMSLFHSVQSSIPKDPAVLWNTEFIQAEELFKEPHNVINCLRDNRGGMPINNTTSLQGKKVEQSNPKPDKGKDVQNGSLKGHASAKPKLEIASVKTEKSIPISNDAQVLENEMVENDINDDENDQIKFKRGSNGEGSNRKRRVMFDYSDEDDEEKDAVSLASPDLPKKQVSVDLKTKKPSLENKNLDFDEQKK
ncbi:hypothetical protein L2E82_29587 [Cichorium intybus]|uniref:Uncharacterized protein n=1 Tax=Cichorium intybus TaxID=13427 RepID=A0ACB9CYE7_CICIN|nr:hypothetical protein L2E82_29587 [Cichorium intybus]